MKYLTNLWYCVALATEVTKNPFRRMICNLPLVLYRSASGEVVALEDRCSHRQAPLSMGEIRGDEIQCNYHGYVFNRRGKCVHIPHQEVIPTKAHIKSFAVVEKFGFVWIWWGDFDKADEAKVPTLPWTEEVGRRAVYLRFYVKANFQLVADNLLDISHADYLHTNSFGSKSGKKGGPKPGNLTFRSEIVKGRVESFRLLENVEIGPVAKKWGGFTKNVNRTNIQMWEPPNTVHVHLEFENDENHILINHDHIMTPETEKTTHYFMDWTRNFGLDGGYPSDKDAYDEQYSIISGEDIPMIEAQQRNIDSYSNLTDVPSKADKLVNDVHLLQRRLYEQAGIKAPAEVANNRRSK